jgi:polar amino acid transport system permease protein
MENALELLAYSPPGWGGALLRGLLATVQIALGAYILGLIIGLFGAMGKIYGGPVLRWSLEIYTTLIRAIPELVLILLLYYAGSDFLNFILESMGFERVDINALAAGIFVIGFVQGAYSTEVLRGAFQAVNSGQIEAGKAIGLSRIKLQTRVIIPAMLPYALPGLANLWLIATKDTALLAVVGFSELALVTKQAATGSREYMLFFVAAGCLYLALSLVSTLIFSLIERHYRRGQRDQG